MIRFDEIRGYGFVAPDVGAEDVFLHVNDLTFDKRLLTQGARVRFVVEESDRGPKACQVQMIDEVATEPAPVAEAGTPDDEGAVRHPVDRRTDYGAHRVVGDFGADHHRGTDREGTGMRRPDRAGTRLGRGLTGVRGRGVPSGEVSITVRTGAWSTHAPSACTSGARPADQPSGRCAGRAVGGHGAARHDGVRRTASPPVRPRTGGDVPRCCSGKTARRDRRTAGNSGNSGPTESPPRRADGRGQSTSDPNESE